MAEKCCCIICKKEFSIKGIHTHYERQHGNKEEQTKYSSGYNNRYSDKKYLDSLKNGLNKSLDKKLGLTKEFKVSCYSCNSLFKVIEREKQFPSKEKYFCSRSCANKRIVTKEHKEKTSKSLKRKKNLTKICLHCNNEFTTTKNSKKCCGVICSNKHRSLVRRKNRSAFQNYRADCSFKFNLSDYSNEFDFSLIENFGWYKPKNRGNNLNGISRDHIISVRYGFDNNIDPYIISHPANCQLMQHNKNVSKYTKNDMTVEQLIQRIKQWEQKYSPT